MIMCFHFVNQYGNSKAVPLMLINGAPGLSLKGTVWLFRCSDASSVGVCVVLLAGNGREEFGGYG
jgi:hypothetical protein